MHRLCLRTKDRYIGVDFDNCLSADANSKNGRYISLATYRKHTSKIAKRRGLKAWLRRRPAYTITRKETDWLRSKKEWANRDLLAGSFLHGYGHSYSRRMIFQADLSNAAKAIYAKLPAEEQAKIKSQNQSAQASTSPMTTPSTSRKQKTASVSALYDRDDTSDMPATTLRRHGVDEAFGVWTKNRSTSMERLFANPPRAPREMAAAGYRKDTIAKAIRETTETYCGESRARAGACKSRRQQTANRDHTERHIVLKEAIELWCAIPNSIVGGDSL